MKHPPQGAVKSQAGSRFAQQVYLGTAVRLGMEEWEAQLGPQMSAIATAAQRGWVG